MKSRNNQAVKKICKQAGMTLIELTVVLMILIGLAGLLVPYVSGFVGRTHDSSGADAIQEVTKAISGYDAKYGGLPGNLDRLVDSNGVVVPYLMNSGVATATAVSTTNTVSLFRAGITQLKGVCDIATDAACTNFNPTFNYYKAANDWAISMNGNISIGGAAAAAPGATDTILTVAPNATADVNNNVEDICGITNAAVDANTDGTNDYIYVMLGVGPSSDMTGRTVQSAPVHFAQVGAMNANNRYNRFLGIFKVDNDPAVGPGPGGIENATLVCSVMSMSRIEGPQQALERYYDRQANEG